MPRAVRAANVEASCERFAGGVVNNLSFREHLLPLGFALFYDRQWIGRRLLRIDIAGEIAERDHFESVRVQVAHELLETIWPRVYPRMLAIRHSMKLQHSDSTPARLLRCSFEVVERPIRPRVTRGGNHQRVIRAWFVGESAAPFVRVLRRAAAPGKPNAEILEYGHRLNSDGIARIREADRLRNAELSATSIDSCNLFAQLTDG